MSIFLNAARLAAVLDVAQIVGVSIATVGRRSTAHTGVPEPKNCLLCLGAVHSAATLESDRI